MGFKRCDQIDHTLFAVIFSYFELKFLKTNEIMVYKILIKTGDRNNV